MIENVLKILPINEITYPEEGTRARIDLQSVYPLALNIAMVGLAQNILVRKENLEVLFGGRRYHAFKLINLALYSPDKYEQWMRLRVARFLEPVTFTSDQLARLAELAKANPLYDSWQKIPVRVIKNASAVSRAALRFVENACREDLPWQERMQSAIKIHREAASNAKQRNEYWSDKQTAELLGMDPSALSKLLDPIRKTTTLSPELRSRAEKIITESTSPLSASRGIEATAERHGETLAPKLRTTLRIPTNSKPAAPTPSTPPPPSAGESLIQLANFNEWAPNYTDQPFNFLHCDFPYGIEFNESVGNKTSAATKTVGQYNDDEEVYWELLTTLLGFRGSLLAPSAHIMFWLSVGESKKLKRPMYDETRDRIRSAWPDAVISSVPLIWHCSDNSGLISDARRAPRRTYEWALHITIGDRPLAKAKAASFSHPRNSEVKIHRSQKPRDVLSHFFGMFVDTSTIMLDPTCGSGTSVLTARKLGAKSVLGLELHPDMRASAVKYFDKEMRG